MTSVWSLKNAMRRIKMYTTEWCGACVCARSLLESKGADYEEVRLDDDPAFRAKLLELTGRWTVPQIVVDGHPIGGYSELRALDRDGRLDELLAA
jgi:glutaredoxin 3